MAAPSLAPASVAVSDPAVPTVTEVSCAVVHSTAPPPLCTALLTHFRLAHLAAPSLAPVSVAVSDPAVPTMTEVSCAVVYSTAPSTALSTHSRLAHLAAPSLAPVSVAVSDPAVPTMTGVSCAVVHSTAPSLTCTALLTPVVNKEVTDMRDSLAHLAAPSLAHQLALSTPVVYVHVHQQLTLVYGVTEELARSYHMQATSLSHSPFVVQKNLFVLWACVQHHCTVCWEEKSPVRISLVQQTLERSKLIWTEKRWMRRVKKVVVWMNFASTHKTILPHFQSHLAEL